MSNSFLYQQYSENTKMVNNYKDNVDDLEHRVNKFKGISSYEDAIKLANEIMPTNREITSFSSGNAKCTVVKKYNLLRITYESLNDFICYDFHK